METNQPKISVKDLTEEITLLIKEEIAATYGFSHACKQSKAVYNKNNKKVD